MDGTTLPDHIERVAMVARWKPVHLGHAAVLRALVDYADEVTIGIGSSNKYDARNPFTARESQDMIDLALSHSRACYRVMEIPDLGHGPRWRAMVKDMFGPLDMFVTANRYVRSLLIDDYLVVHPVHLVDAVERRPLDATMVRRAMASGADWESLVPAPVAEYLRERGLVRRLIEEFGAEILAN